MCAHVQQLESNYITSFLKSLPKLDGPAKIINWN